MWRDPIVEEIHKIREEYARQFDYNVDAICKDIQIKQANSGRKLVSFPARRPEPAECNHSEVRVSIHV
uniref:Uncharacterized protein n=1 Tax=Candidatus Kentrum sp. MB TaxID=2138164 RepID=A0A450XIQ7_9GAMM|nr:MAG: hypothetical protein BECKMB1821G_GA0114241_101326 [Candidatus Kentron sp. MB]VFK29144.1 MAG: hypothetical protein BECKMB1821I_GA0114274_100850 [Candidatus Kentron sp. MB]VFK74690.1 MAG: hypothetical protein BECKMB1821H_GA0114242_100849 [Candidatus Kentron sp. MB]